MSKPELFGCHSYKFDDGYECHNLVPVYQLDDYTAKVARTYPRFAAFYKSYKQLQVLIKYLEQVKTGEMSDFSSQIENIIQKIDKILKEAAEKNFKCEKCGTTVELAKIAVHKNCDGNLPKMFCSNCSNVCNNGNEICPICHYKLTNGSLMALGF